MFNKNSKRVEAGPLKLGQHAQLREFVLLGCECKMLCSAFGDGFPKCGILYLELLAL